MTVRVEKLEAPAVSLLAIAINGAISTATTALLLLWQRPTVLTMSDDWLGDRARIESRRGSW